MFAWQRAAKDPEYAQKYLESLVEKPFAEWPQEALDYFNQRAAEMLGETDQPQPSDYIQLHPAQQRVLSEAQRFNAVDCGRRWGKTFFGKYLSTETLLTGEPAAWMAPNYRSLKESWRELKTLLLPLTAEKSEQDFRLELTTGGTLECWSLDNPDAPRGRFYKRVIVDEAAMVRGLGEIVQAVIMPMLADVKGDLWLLSTPKGMNFFRTAYVWGQDPAKTDWASWQMPSVSNTTIEHLPEEVERMRSITPDRWFRQEYEAEFIDDAGGVFRNVQQAATVESRGDEFPYYAAHLFENDVLTPPPDHQYVIGIDWGKLNDFTVLSVIDATDRQLVALDRFNRIDYEVQIKRLKALAARFGTRTLIPERNSIGEPIIERLKSDGYSVHPFTTTNASKAEAIDALTLAFERNELAIMDVPVLIDELQGYEAERLPSGMLRYSAPEGMHDDCVMSLALAYHGASTPARQADETFSCSYFSW